MTALAFKRSEMPDPVAAAIEALVERNGAFVGLVSTLYGRLPPVGPRWPAHPARFGAHLRRVVPALQAAGIAVEIHRTRAGMIVTVRPGRVSLAATEADALCPFPDALALLVRLRLASEITATTPDALARHELIPGWGLRRYAAAVRRLRALGFLPESAR